MRLTRVVGLVAGGALVVSLIVMAATAAWPRQEQALVTVLSGVAQEGDGKTLSPLHSGSTVVPGAHVRTANNGRVAIDFVDGSVTRLGTNSEVVVQSLVGLEPAAATELEQRTGSAWYDVRIRAQNAPFTIHAGSAAIESHGGSFEVDVTSNGVAISSWIGSVSVEAGQGKASVGAGQATVVTNAPPIKPQAISSDARNSGFAILNQVLDLTRGPLLTLAGGKLGTPPIDKAVGKFFVATGQELQVGAGWPPGADYTLVMRGPDGTAEQVVKSSASPISAIVSKPEVGIWQFELTNNKQRLPPDWWLDISWRPSRQLEPAKVSPAPSPSAPLSDPSCSQESAAHSTFVATDRLVNVDIYNRSDVNLTLYWLDYQHRRVRYSVFEPGDSVSQPSYPHAVWIMTDGSGRCVRLFRPPGPVVIK